MKVLIVDDSRMSRIAMHLALPAELRETCEFFEGENGQEAVSVYKEQNPDLVFLDLTMPVMDGYEALRQIISYDPDAKVLVVSSDSQSGAIQRALKLGAKTHIKKPIKAATLLPILETII